MLVLFKLQKSRFFIAQERLYFFNKIHFRARRAAWRLFRWVVRTIVATIPCVAPVWSASIPVLYFCHYRQYYRGHAEYCHELHGVIGKLTIRGTLDKQRNGCDGYSTKYTENPVLHLLASFRVVPVERMRFDHTFWSRQRDLNPRPAVYKTAALPLSYAGMANSVSF